MCSVCVAWKDECVAVCNAITCVTLSLEEVAGATKVELQEASVKFLVNTTDAERNTRDWSEEKIFC